MSDTGKPLRLMIYDRTCKGPYSLPGLTASWILGGALYQALGRFDAWAGAETWGEALDWLAAVEPNRSIGEIQYWGHGKWGYVLIAQERLDVKALEPGHPLEEKLATIRARLAGPSSRWWFRTCSTFGKAEGHDFAKRWSSYFDCEAAGHTYVIHWAQSGLHRINPGEEPSWSVQEGVPEASEGNPPTRAIWSSFDLPNTISCLRGTIPKGF